MNKIIDFCIIENLSNLKDVLQKTRNINSYYDEQNALHLFTKMGNFDLVHACIMEGADVNLTDSKLWTPLHFAASIGNEGIMNMLIFAGADIDTRNIVGETPIYLAIINNFASCVQILADKGANIEQRNHGKKLMNFARRIAIKTKDCSCVIALKEAVLKRKESTKNGIELHIMRERIEPEKKKKIIKSDDTKDLEESQDDLEEDSEVEEDPIITKERIINEIYQAIDKKDLKKFEECLTYISADYYHNGMTFIYRVAELGYNDFVRVAVKSLIY